MISVIIPCYWANEDLIQMTSQCLESLKAYTDGEYELIVIDDGSPLKYRATVSLPANKGYAGAVNAGLEAATGDVIVIGNNDLTFMPGWLGGLLKPLEAGYDVSSIVTSDQGYITEDKITAGDRFGSLWAMKRKVYETVGPLDEALGTGYFSDTDYHMRIQQARFRVAKYWGALVEHKGAASFVVADPDNKGFHDSMARFKEKYGFII